MSHGKIKKQVLIKCFPLRLSEVRDFFSYKYVLFYDILLFAVAVFVSLFIVISLMYSHFKNCPFKIKSIVDFCYKSHEKTKTDVLVNLY